MHGVECTCILYNIHRSIAQVVYTECRQEHILVYVAKHVLHLRAQWGECCVECVEYNQGVKKNSTKKRTDVPGEGAGMSCCVYSMGMDVGACVGTRVYGGEW